MMTQKVQRMPVDLVELTEVEIDPNVLVVDADVPVPPEDVTKLKHILEGAVKIQKKVDDRLGSAPADASKALEDIENDIKQGKDPTADIQGKDKDAVMRAIAEVSSGVSVEDAIKKDALMTSKLLQEINNE